MRDNGRVVTALDGDCNTVPSTVRTVNHRAFGQWGAACGKLLNGRLAVIDLIMPATGGVDAKMAITLVAGQVLYSNEMVFSGVCVSNA